MMPQERQKRTPSIASSAVLMMTALVLGKILGQVREILIAPQIGVGFLSDGYIIGFQIPDLLYQLLIGGAIQAAITPTLAGAIETGRLRQGWRSVSIFLNVAAIAMLVCIVLGELLAPVLLPLFYSGKSADTLQVAVSVTRTLFPQVFFMMLAALCIGILNAYKRFHKTAFGPVFYNVGVVLSLILLGNRTLNGTVRVAAGIMLSACLFFLLQFFLARREFRHYYRFSINIRDTGFRRLLRLALPTMLAASITQINIIVLTAFTNRFFPDGMVTALRYASTTWQLPYGILAVAIGNVLLPNLSGPAQSEEGGRFRRLFGNGLRSAFFLLMPVAGMIFIMREDVVRGIFQWGGVLPESMVSATASILLFYSVSILIQSLIFLFSIACFAAGNTRLPLRAGVVSLAVNLTATFLLTRIPGIGPWAMSLAFVLAGSCSAFLIVKRFRKRYPQFRPAGFGRLYLIKLLLSLGTTLLVLYALTLIGGSPETKSVQLLWLAARGLAGLGTFYLAARGLNVPESLLWGDRIRALAARVGERIGFRNRHDG